jgi:hypothetical protein
LIACLLCAVRATPITRPEILVNNYMIDMPCSMPPAAVRGLLTNTTYLHLAAREWSGTHIISGWSSTSFSNAMDATAEQLMQEYSIPHGTQHARARYDSEVMLPGILAPFMNVRVSLHITKDAYVVDSTMYTVTGISGLPVLGECVIYSRHVALEHQIASRNTLFYPPVPWYLKIVQPVIEQAMRDSEWRQSWAMARAWCGELHVLD